MDIFIILTTVYVCILLYLKWSKPKTVEPEKPLFLKKENEE